jgi:predicted PurR-regulated permease PerM
VNTFNRNWLWIAGLLVLGALVYYFSDIVTYILLAWVLSMLGRPLMVFFMRRLRVGRMRIGAGGAAVLTILTFYAVLAGVVLLFVPTIVTQARHLATVDYTLLGSKLSILFSDFDTQLHSIGLLSDGESLGTKAQELAGKWFHPAMLGNFLKSFVAVAGNILVTLTAVTFILFFFLQDSTMFTDMLHALAPAKLESKIQHAIRESSDMLTRYFLGLLIQLTAFACSVSLILWILGIPNALLIGVSGGLFNVIPYVGPILGGLFGCFITLSSNLDANADLALLLPPLLKVLAAFGITQFIDNNFLGPLIFSNSVKAHPLEIFIVTLIAAKLGGVVGMVVGIPVYTILRVIARVFFSEFRVVRILTDHLDEGTS